MFKLQNCRFNLHQSNCKSFRKSLNCFLEHQMKLWNQGNVSMKKAKICNESQDFISDLPDPILVHILSFLPINDAVRTVLLRRFGNLWRGVQVLDFEDNFHKFEDPDCRPDRDEDFVNLIRHVLNLHNSSVLDKVCLKFEFSTPCMKGGGSYGDELEWEKSTSDQLEKLIRYAMSRKVKVLDLSLKQYTPVFEEGDCYNLPDVLSSSYLTSLKLAAFDITRCTTIDLKSLKVLLLDEVSLNDETMRELLAGCPFLENLSLIDCYGLEALFCKNPNLKKLMVSLNEEEKILVITCPYVLSLEIYGWIRCARLLQASSVVDACISFSCSFRCERDKCLNICELLQKVRQCKTFSPCTLTVLVFTIWAFTNMPCPSFEWNNLILKLSLTKWHHPGLSLLLRNSQSLQTLTMHIYPASSFWADTFFKKPEAKWIEAYEFDMDKFWDSQEANFPSLKTIMIYGYVNEPYVIEMVKFLLRSATSLQKLVISTQIFFKPAKEEMWCFHGPVERLGFQFTSEQLQELSGKFKSLPTASPDAVIYFS